MYKLAIITFVTYLWGAPAYSDIRPAFIDQQLQSYHLEVNQLIESTFGLKSIAQSRLHSSAQKFSF